MKTPFAFRKLPAGLATLAIAALTACSSTPPQNSADTPQLLRTASQTTAQLLLLGEQHDAPSHPALHAQVLHNLAQRGQLAALALEMADAGTSTHGLPRDASESQVQQALRWNEPGWPWAHYQQAVMTAVAAGVPVLGANLPRSQMANAMKNIAAHALFSSAKWQNHLDNIRSGHCDMLPVSQIEPMARMQVQRDITMAQTLLQALPAASAAASAAPSGSASTITPPTATAHRGADRWCLPCRPRFGRARAHAAPAPRRVGAIHRLARRTDRARRLRAAAQTRKTLSGLHYQQCLSQQF
jgi:Haem-binding uptake, Tiki superfamily, ChaN